MSELITFFSANPILVIALLVLVLLIIIGVFGDDWFGTAEPKLKQKIKEESKKAEEDTDDILGKEIDNIMNEINIEKKNSFEDNRAPINDLYPSQDNDINNMF